MIQRNAIDPSGHAARIEAFRRARLARLTAEDGWLSLAGRHWLHEGVQRAGCDASCEVLLPEGKAPAFVGAFTLQAGVVSFLPAPEVDAKLRRAGRAEPSSLVAEQALPLVTDRDGAPDRIVIGPLSLEIMQRDCSFAVRVRDRDSATRLGFSGIDCFAIRHELCVEARLERVDPPRMIDLAYESGRGERNPSPGTLVFELGGRVCRLDPVIESGSGRWLVVFGDETNRDLTYGAGRFLYAAMPDGERVVLDFNQAFNPPCAFSPYAMCPLPPPQNRLPLRVEAGEKKPRELHT
jgi:uncharacterized protein